MTLQLTHPCACPLAMHAWRLSPSPHLLTGVPLLSLRAVQVLDACLFEPGQWQAEYVKQVGRPPVHQSLFTFVCPSFITTSFSKLKSLTHYPPSFGWALLLQVPTEIPPSTRSHLATPCGLLFNELVQSPANVVDSLMKMLELVRPINQPPTTHPAAARSRQPALWWVHHADPDRRAVVRAGAGARHGAVLGVVVPRHPLRHPPRRAGRELHPLPAGE